MNAHATHFPSRQRLARLVLEPFREGRVRRALFRSYYLETTQDRPVIVIRSESGRSFLLAFLAVPLLLLAVPMSSLSLVVALIAPASAGGGWPVAKQSLTVLVMSSLYGAGLFVTSRWMRRRFEVIDYGGWLVFARRGLLVDSQAFSKSDLREVEVRHEIKRVPTSDDWQTLHTCDLELIVHAKTVFSIARWLDCRHLAPAMARRLALDLCRQIGRTGRQIVVDRRPLEGRCQHREVASYDLHESRFDEREPRHERVSARELERFFAPGDLAIPRPRVREPVVIIPPIRTTPYPLASDAKARKMGEDADAPEEVRPRARASLAWRLRRELTFAWVQDLPEWAPPILWGLGASIPIAFFMFIARSWITGRW